MASDFAFSIEGIFDLRKRIQDESQRKREKLAAALFEEAKIEMAEAKRRTPFETGELQKSGTVHPPEIKENEISVTMTFGETPPSSEYAIFVHEDLDAIHPIGEAKFLETVVLESAGHMAERVGRRVGD